MFAFILLVWRKCFKDAGWLLCSKPLFYCVKVCLQNFYQTLLFKTVKIFFVIYALASRQKASESCKTLSYFRRWAKSSRVLMIKYRIVLWDKWLHDCHCKLFYVIAIFPIMVCLCWCSLYRLSGPTRSFCSWIVFWAVKAVFAHSVWTAKRPENTLNLCSLVLMFSVARKFPGISAKDKPRALLNFLNKYSVNKGFYWEEPGCYSRSVKLCEGLFSSCLQCTAQLKLVIWKNYTKLNTGTKNSGEVYRGEEEEKDIINVLQFSVENRHGLAVLQNQTY